MDIPLNQTEILPDRVDLLEEKVSFFSSVEKESLMVAEKERATIKEDISMMKKALLDLLERTRKE
jgi:hypothetical protein